jgi:ketosteroid isomerase-like protein
MTAPEAVTQVVAAQQAWSEVILSNDTDRIAEHMADDWVIVTPDGIVTSDQFLAAIRASALRHTRMEPAHGPDGAPRVRVYADVAVLTQRLSSTEMQGPQTRNNDEWMTTVFTRHDGRWSIALMHLTPADHTPEHRRGTHLE